MVQPRKEQIKDVLTRHSAFTYTPVVGDTYTDILDATINPYLISDTYGGIQEDIQATVLGTVVEPQPVVAGDSITIAIDGGLPVTILFSVSDTTTSRIAANINGAVGTTIASNENGYLRITSQTYGITSKLIFADVVAGTLAKLGIAAGTYIGDEAPIRGVVTKSQDLRGGFVRIKTTDEKSVLTEVPSLIQFGESNTVVPAGKTRYWKNDIQGGVPVYGRMTRNPTNTGYRIFYYAKMPLEPEVITYDSDFTALDAFDEIDVTLTYGPNTVGPINIAFSSPPYTRSSVINTINAAFGFASTGGGNGQAKIIGNICQPYSFTTTPIISFSIKVDGGIIQTFILDVTHITAQNVVSQINASVTGVTASVSNYCVQIVSNETNGLLSSLELIGDNWNKLGISQGLYRGNFIVESYANSEIKFRGLGRGGEYSLTISSSNPTSMARMGLGSGAPVVVVGADEGEQAVNFPDIHSYTSTTNFPVNVLIPEVLEFGEVDPAVESIVEQFNNKVIGNNQEGAFSSVGINDSLLYPYGVPLSRGTRDVGKPVLINSLGEIDFDLMRSVYVESRRTFAQFIRGDFRLGVNTVNALVTSIIETPGTGGNPASTSPSIILDIDPSAAHSGNASLWVRFYRDATGRIPVIIKDATAEALGDGITDIVSLSSGAGIHRGSSALRISDVNTVAAGTATSSSKTLPLSDSTSRYIRVLEKEANTLSPSLLKKVNAIWAVTIGDGINSFGDFNGSNAIQQAIAFYTSSGATGGIHIRCKNGNFRVNSTNGSIIVPSSVSDFYIEGNGREDTIIRADSDATTPVISIPAGGSIQLENISIWGNSSASTVAISMASSGGSIVATNCNISTAQLVLNDINNCRFNNCSFWASTLSCIRMILSNGTTSENMVFRDCYFSLTGNDKTPLSIEALNSTIPVTTISKILFDNCKINLTSATTYLVGPNTFLTKNCGVVDLVPNGSCYNTGTGIYVKELTYDNCHVSAPAASVSVLIHLLPVNNGHVVYNATTEFAFVKTFVISGGEWISSATSDTGINLFTILGVQNITIRNVEMGFRSAPSYGVATGEVGYWATGDVTAPVPSRDWGAFALYASDSLVMNNVRFKSFVQKSGIYGDLFIRYKYLDIDNVIMRDYYAVGGGAATGPWQRIRLRPVSDAGRASVKKLSVGTHLNAGVGSDWADEACVYYEPNQAHFTFDDCQIGPFAVSGGSTAAMGILIPSLTSTDYSGQNLATTNLTICNCSITGMSNGIMINHSASGQTNTGVSIINNNIYDNTYYGIRLGQNGTTGGYFKNCSISNNRITDNGSYGIYTHAVKWINNCNVSILNNRVYNNNGGITTAQIRIWVQANVAVTFETPVGICTGNDTSSGNITSGKIKINQTNGVPAEVALPGSGIYGDPMTNVHMRGIDVGHVSGFDNRFNFLDTDVHMVHNFADLETP